MGVPRAVTPRRLRPRRLVPADHQRHHYQTVRIICCPLCNVFHFTYPPLKSASCTNTNQEINGCAKGIHPTVPTTTPSRANQPSENALPSGAYLWCRATFPFCFPHPRSKLILLQCCRGSAATGSRAGAWRSRGSREAAAEAAEEAQAVGNLSRLCLSAERELYR